MSDSPSLPDHWAAIAEDRRERWANEIDRADALQAEIDRLRAGIQWCRGMLTDREPHEIIDAKLGEILNDA